MQIGTHSPWEKSHFPFQNRNFNAHFDARCVCFLFVSLYYGVCELSSGIFLLGFTCSSSSKPTKRWLLDVFRRFALWFPCRSKIPQAINLSISSTEKRRKPECIRKTSGKISRISFIKTKCAKQTVLIRRSRKFSFETKNQKSNSNEMKLNATKRKEMHFVETFIRRNKSERKVFHGTRIIS